MGFEDRAYGDPAPGTNDARQGSPGKCAAFLMEAADDGAAHPLIGHPCIASMAGMPAGRIMIGETPDRKIPGIVEVLNSLSKTHKPGMISDTWPSIEAQPEHIGISQYLSFRTFSCFAACFKPDKRIYQDALKKCGVPAGETVLIDDAVRSLEGAAALGNTPIRIAANPASDVETTHTKIRDMRELIR